MLKQFSSLSHVIDNRYEKVMSDIYNQMCSILYTILRDEKFSTFKIACLKDAFINASPYNHKPDRAYQFIYREVNKLLKFEALTKTRVECSNAVIYKKTESFTHVSYSVNRIQKHDRHLSKRINNYKKSTVKQLKSRLKKSETDLLTNIGESEEYMNLHRHFPEMKEHLESQYLLTLEKNSKILGQIRALKSALSYHQSQSNDNFTLY